MNNELTFSVSGDRITIRFRDYLLILDFKDAESDAETSGKRINGIAVVVNPVH